jgi:ubiquinone/menaquinone biosynthesis C-methylase UbiE
MSNAYVHGYDLRESIRLQDQAATLVDLLHSDTMFFEGSHVLEAGCGVGAQTVIIAQKNPGALISSIDISEASLAEARKKIEAVGITNVTFKQGDIFDLPFQADSFDHLLVCFVIEHLVDPVAALTTLKQSLKPGGKASCPHAACLWLPVSPQHTTSAP